MVCMGANIEFLCLYGAIMMKVIKTNADKGRAWPSLSVPGDAHDARAPNSYPEKHRVQLMYTTTTVLIRVRR